MDWENKTAQQTTHHVVDAAPSSARSQSPQQDETLLSVVWRQRWLVAMCVGVCALLMLIYLIAATPLYTVTAQLYVQKGNMPLMGEKGLGQTQTENYLYTQVGMIKSSQTLALAMNMPGADEMKTFAGIRNRVAYLKNNVEADVGKKDDIITLTFDSAYPVEGRKIVDAIIESYVARASRDTRSTAQEMLAILEKEKDKREIELAKKSEKLVEFRRTYNTLSFEDKATGNLTMQKLAGLSDALNAAHLATLDSRSTFEEVCRGASVDPDSKDLAKPGAIALSSLNEEKYRTELADLTSRRAELASQYMTNHPITKAMDARISQLQAMLLSSARQRWVAAQQREQDLQRSFDEQQKQALEMSARATEFARLQKDVTSLEETITSIDNRVKEVALAGDAGELNITIVDNASTDDKPNKPNKMRMMALALAVGLVLGVSGGLVREWANPTLRSEEEVKAALGIPVLGLVPRVAGGMGAESHGWAVQNEPDSELAEAYRSVRTAVTFSAPEGKSRTIAITSPSNGDGKSTLVSNLAIAMAKAGKRVLVIDADFRSPSQHKIFGVSDETGFSSVLSTGEPIEQVIRRTAVERLDVLPCGPVPRDPSELLNSGNFNNVLEGLASIYDHVVIDSPATSGVSDARIVAASCDVTILVMRAEKSSRRLAENARDGLLSVGAHLLGVVMNDVPAGNRQDGSGDGISGLPILDRAVAKLTGTKSGSEDEVFTGRAGGISTSA